MLMRRLIRPGRRDCSGPVSARHRAINLYFARRASMASINIPVIEIGYSASISRTQVGLVTLISVKRSPIISRPTKISPLALSVGPTRRAISQSLSLNGRGSPRPPAARGCRGFRRPAEYAPAVRHRLAVDDRDALIAIFDRGQIVLCHAVAVAQLGQRFGNNAYVRIAFLNAENGRAAHTVQRFHNDIAVLFPKRFELRFIARYQRFRRQIGKPAVYSFSLQSRRLCGLLTISVPSSSARSRI